MHVLPKGKPLRTKQRFQTIFGLIFINGHTLPFLFAQSAPRHDPVLPGVEWGRPTARRVVKIAPHAKHWSQQIDKTLSPVRSHRAGVHTIQETVHDSGDAATESSPPSDDKTDKKKPSPALLYASYSPSRVDGTGCLTAHCPPYSSFVL